ncbi:MAG: cyclic nucleotide-binding domain-containing protein [Deltaproteobacteria bacterium]|nr:cyclic nucleotide-binding domain-containing protein [Deltaproteobacteria bacterium]
MDYVRDIIGERALDKTKIQRILEKSLTEKDFFCRKSRDLLNMMGLERDEALMLLAHHKSKIKYGYSLSSTSLSHLIDLAKEKGATFQRLIESPFFLVKACWLYEHVPYFLFYNKSRLEDIDAFIIKFATTYDTLFLKNRVSIDKWEKKTNPRRLRTVSFWGNQTFDPVSLLEKARHENIEGLELSIDFHPFNYTKLLPEELTIKKREEIKQACERGGMKIDVHSPIIGPYFPSPDPNKGEQLFFDPLKCFELMCETIELAKDIGAGSVVVHLIDTSNLKKMADLIMKAEGSRVRVTIENYCQTKNLQSSDLFIACVDEIFKALPREVRNKNFGITLDVGHLNIEGEDPLVASEKIGRWCLMNEVYLRVHATDNYGKLLFYAPAYSADVHGNVSGRGINNAIIIKLLRSMGHQFDVVAEQIQPLSQEDIATIHDAQTSLIDGSFESFVLKGKEMLSAIRSEALITPEIIQENAYSFLAGMEGISALREHLVFRKIQDKKYLSVDEAKKISQNFMKMPLTFRHDLIDYVDDLLLPIQSERGVIQKSELDLICQNISGALFGTINNEHLNQIFSQTKIYHNGDILCGQNATGHEMFFIQEGEVTVFINGSPVASLGSGEIFGEISLFYDVKRTATIKAAKDNTRVGILTRSGFEVLLKNSQPYSYDLIYRLYNILPERLRNLNDKYKTVINALNLIMDGNKKEIPGVDHIIQSEIKSKKELLSTLTQKETKSVFKELKIFNKDDLIFAEGDRGEGAYLILEGKVKAVTFSKDYEEIVLGELGKDEIFGEMALIDDRPRSASIVTVTPCKVGFVDKQEFNEFIETRSDLAFRFMAFICLSLFRRILRLDRIYADTKKAFG